MFVDELLPKCEMLESNLFSTALLCTVTPNHTYSYNHKKIIWHTNNYTFHLLINHFSNYWKKQIRWCSYFCLPVNQLLMRKHGLSLKWSIDNCDLVMFFVVMILCVCIYMFAFCLFFFKSETFWQNKSDLWKFRNKGNLLLHQCIAR